MRPFFNGGIVQDPKNPKKQSCETMLIWGNATWDAKVGETKNGYPKASFQVAYGKDKFMHVVSTGDCPQTRIAKRVRKGEAVLILGRWWSDEYGNGDGKRVSSGMNIEQIYVLSDDYRESLIDCLWTAFANAMSKGYIHDRSEFMRAFNTGFVDAFWELCQNMQGEEPQENSEGDAAGGDDYELTI